MTAQLVLAATNMLMGPANFGSLELPEAWTLGSGIAPPEVDRSRSWGGVAWVTNGRADWILRRSDPRLHIELRVRVTPRRGGVERPSAPSRVPADAAQVEVNGHEARSWRGSGRRGLLPRRSVSWLRGWVPCTHTGREVELEVIGACPAADLDDLAILIERLRCH